MSKVTLSSCEIFQGAMIGVMRRVRDMKAGRSERHNVPAGGGWQRDIEGALGEVALAKSLNVFIADHNDMKCPDVGSVDCRMTPRENGRLIIHPDDPDDRAFYLVTGAYGDYVVRGWIRGGDAKRVEWWTDPSGGRPAYFVPQDALTP